jgi:hypothetical protein
MDTMSRRRRTTVSALLASLALLATLPAPCGCLPEPATTAEHSCCAPPPGLRPADPGCCATADVAAHNVAAPASATPAVAPGFVVVAWVTPPATAVLDRGQASPGPAIAPPLTVRRL